MEAWMEMDVAEQTETGKLITRMEKVDADIQTVKEIAARNMAHGGNEANRFVMILNERKDRLATELGRLVAKNVTAKRSAGTTEGEEVTD